VKVDNPTDEHSPIVTASTGDRWGEGGRSASTVSQWKGSSYILLVVLSKENPEAGLAVWDEVGEYLPFVGEGS
jgi:hypothetical protein